MGERIVAANGFALFSPGTGALQRVKAIGGDLIFCCHDELLITEFQKQVQRQGVLGCYVTLNTAAEGVKRLEPAT